MWLTLPQLQDQTQHNNTNSSVVPAGCGEVDTRELGSPAFPELHILRSSEVLKNEIRWHLLIWSCGHGDIELQVGFDNLGDLSQLQ